MSNSSLPPPSPCGSWPWVIVHTFPHSLSPCLSVSLSLSLSLSPSPSTWRGFFLPSFSGGRPTGKLNRIASLRWLTHQHWELCSTPPALQPRQPTSPHPGLDLSPPRPASLSFNLPVSLYISFSVSYSPPGCHFLSLAVQLLPCQDISLLTCFSTPICLPVSLYILTLSRPDFAVCQPVLFVSLPASVSQAVPWHSTAKSKYRRTQRVDSPVCILNYQHLGAKNKMMA